MTVTVLEAEKKLDMYANSHYASKQRWAIYFKGKPIYLSGANVYASKGIAMGKLRGALSDYHQDSSGRYFRVYISKEDLQSMFDSGMVEIKQVQ